MDSTNSLQSVRTKKTITVNIKLVPTCKMKNDPSELHEDFYESLFENTLDGLAYCQVLFDAQESPVDWIYIKVNKNFEKLTGLKGVIGKKVTEVIPGIHASNPELFEIYGRVSLTGESQRFETYVEPLARWFLVSVYRPQKGFFVAIFQNITDQKQAQKDLEDARVAARNVFEDLQVEEENARKFYEAVNAAAEHIIITDADGVILYANKAAERITGYSGPEMIGKRPSLWGGKMDSAFYKKMWKTIKYDKTTFQGEVKNRRKNGQEYFADLYISPILGTDGNVNFFVGIERDLTREKEIEKLRIDFLSLVSHQLRTPLSGTKWLIETIKRGVIGKMTKKQDEYLDQIYQINERMIKLVFDMLSVLRLESEEAVVKKETVPVSDLYEELNITMGPAAKSREVILRNRVKNHKAVVVETDLTMLRSILECFISNAINYSMPSQEITLDLKEESTGVVFSVQDSGIGIPKEEQKRIFERFYRGSNAKIFKPEGTGLGLYVASMLAEKIRATLSFESEEGKGSTFYLRIPKNKVD